MATYNRTYAGESPQDLTMSFSLVERPIYGSSRIANFVDSVQLVYLEAGETEFSYPDDIELLEHANGYKHFELTNHASTPLSTGLGNVMAVVSDKRTPVLNATATAIETFQPELLIAKDYYPFGMEMSGRYGGDNGTEPIDVGYRYGFNGMEKDDEITGHTDKGNHYTATFWEYDARIGRRWNLDPKPNQSISSYATFANNPILYSDPLGDTIRIQKGESFGFRLKVKTRLFVARLFSKSARDVLNYLESSPHYIDVYESSSAGWGEDKYVQWQKSEPQKVNYWKHSHDNAGNITTVFDEKSFSNDYDNWMNQGSQLDASNGVGTDSYVLLNYSTLNKRIARSVAKHNGYRTNSIIYTIHEFGHAFDATNGQMGLTEDVVETSAVDFENKVSKEMNKSIIFRNLGIRPQYNLNMEGSRKIQRLRQKKMDRMFK